MEPLMTQEESYAERRQLFKTIWDTAMNINEKDVNIMNKPKVIKTLRLDEVDKCAVGKNKKQRIKNLRTVCKKILDFCDRQDADNMFYEKMVSDGLKPQQYKVQLKSKKLKHVRVRRKVKKAKSLTTPFGINSAEVQKEGTAKADDVPNFNKTELQDVNIVKPKNINDKKYHSKRGPAIQTIAAPRNLKEISSALASRSKEVINKASKKRKLTANEFNPGSTKFAYSRRLNPTVIIAPFA